jgi:hypothetical protein
MRVWCWENLACNRALVQRCHPERSEGALNRSIEHADYFEASTSLCEILRSAQDDTLVLRGFIRADPDDFPASASSPVPCATSRSRRDFRKARRPELSSREILPGACTAGLRVIRD